MASNVRPESGMDSYREVKRGMDIVHASPV
jgi:hypothetical protein